MQSRTTPMLKWHSKGMLAMFAACCLLLFASVSVFANTVNIYDDANVLNRSQVQSQASALNYPINIYTTNTFTGSSSAFDQKAVSHIGGNANLIVLAIDTRNKHVTATGGKNVPLSNAQYQNAAQSFASGYKSGGYTPATTAAIQSMQNNLGSSSSNSGNSNSGNPVPVGSNSGGGFSFAPLLCCVGLLVVAGIGVFVFVRRRTGGIGRRGAINPVNPVFPQQNYNPNYPNQGQNYGPGYNQGGYNQGGGINPIIPGGIGAVGGGLLGYELGKSQGENEARREGNYGGNGNDNNYGNGGNNFGGGGSADFGNSGGDSSGGGGSADFGNSGGGGGFSGGDFGGGGGGGGSDFGGGSFGGGGDSGGGGGGSF